MADLLDSMTAPPDLWSLLRQDPFAPDNPKAQSQQYPGVSNQAVYNAQRNSLGNVGALLLSSAQRQSPDQRAQTLGQLGNAANITPELNANQQMMMRNQQMQLINTEMQQKQFQLRASKALQEYAKNPDVMKNLEDLPGPSKIAAQLALSSGNVTEFGNIINAAKMLEEHKLLYGAQTKQAEATTEKIKQETAQGNLKEVGGVLYRITPDGGAVPITGGFNAANYGLGGASPQQTPAPQQFGTGSQPFQAIPNSPQPQQTQQPATQPAQTGGQSFVNPNANFGNIFGPIGKLSETAARISDVATNKIPAGLQATQQAGIDLSLISNNAINALTMGSEVPGRLKMVQERVADLIPESGSLTSGKVTAISKLGSLKSMIDQDLQNTMTVINNPLISRAMKEKLVPKAQMLQDTSAQIRTAIGSASQSSTPTADENGWFTLGPGIRMRPRQ